MWQQQRSMPPPPSPASRRRLRLFHSALAAPRSRGAVAAPTAGAAADAVELCLTDAQRDACLESLDRDSFCVLPVRLPRHMIERANDYMDGYMHNPARVNTSKTDGNAARPLTGGGGLLTEMGIVEEAPIFREYLTFQPALQLCYDVFGPMFHLAHDKWSRKLRPEDTPPHLTPDSSFPFGWHSDGPVGFPEVDGHVPMNILRFGFLTSSTEHAGSGTIEFMRSSHRTMRCSGAQSSLRFEPLGTTQHLQNPEVLTDGDKGTDPTQYHTMPSQTRVFCQNVCPSRLPTYNTAAVLLLRLGTRLITWRSALKLVRLSPSRTASGIERCLWGRPRWAGRGVSCTLGTARVCCGRCIGRCPVSTSHLLGNEYFSPEVLIYIHSYTHSLGG
jgi:hypothetical protein